MGEHINLGLRISALPDSSMIARRAGNIRQIVSASREYLSQNGIPKRLEDIVHHQCVVISRRGAPPVNWHLRVKGKSIDFTPANLRLMIGTVEGTVDALVQSAGLGTTVFLSNCTAY